MEKPDNFRGLPMYLALEILPGKERRQVFLVWGEIEKGAVETGEYIK